MSIEIRLGSVVINGVGGPEAGALNLIYSQLLKEFGQDLYRRIGINQIGEDLEEFVDKESGNRVHVNIRWPTPANLDALSTDEQNRYRLEVLHASLLRVAEFDHKLDINILEEIREKVLAHNFSFEFVCASFPNKKVKGMTTKVVVRPEIKGFIFYIIIEDQGKEKCRLRIYNGLRDIVIFAELFSIGKWKSKNEFLLTGKRKELEITVYTDDCRMETKNLTPYPNPPYFQMMREDNSQEERDKAFEDYLHSLPPAHAAILRRAHN
jgi:hypothetical protein